MEFKWDIGFGLQDSEANPVHRKGMAKADSAALLAAVRPSLQDEADVRIAEVERCRELTDSCAYPTGGVVPRVSQLLANHWPQVNPKT